MLQDKIIPINDVSRGIVRAFLMPASRTENDTVGQLIITGTIGLYRQSRVKI
jgi:hypothetical protein